MGNIRLSYLKSITGNIEVVEEDNYYAFGMKHAGYNNIVTGLGNASAQKIEYNGKEYQDELGLDWYDYGWRNYDAAIGRWHNVDPLAEISRRWSPYNYCYNNPVVFTDPDGMMALSFSDYNWKTGTYNSGSFEATMAKNGIKFTPVDSATGGLIYAVGKDAFEAMSGLQNRSDGGGDDGPGLLRRIWNAITGKNKSEVVVGEPEIRAIPDRPTMFERFLNCFNFFQPSQEASDARAEDIRVFTHAANETIEFGSYCHATMLTIMTLPIGGEGGFLAAGETSSIGIGT